ncbi:Beta-phosphoglucomutase [uncultured Rubrobacteraceae bacterium]|uniref:Beta-phosphoglucomutase n=1 Tax=uncultured Rubrobacteraceae bacterium TaxID=349277 RepID=A0A6J4PC10_9ACTN|nr:Beta-phosphoglucomutase [uncultured Rubrobacteraceae bacterium]
MYRALLFDLDGTLAETDPVHLPTWVDVLEPYGVEVDEEFYRDSISGRNTNEIIRSLLPNLTDEENRSIGDAKEASFRERASELEPLPGLLDFVERGRELGMKIALVTNAPEENVEAILLALKLRDFFDVVVLADEVEAVKPHPAPYKAALRKTGVRPEEALAFEDSLSGISSSVAAGIPTVGITSSQNPETLLGAGAFMTAQDFTDERLRALIGTRR